MKVALEEWRHGLEGAEQPFLVCTDHQNPEYLQNPAQWFCIEFAHNFLTL